MKRITARRIGWVIFGCMLASAAVLMYLQIIGELMLGIALVGITFVLSMGLLWMSELEDEAAEREKKDRRISRFERSR
ncbi:MULTISPECIES: hypothetical protein [Paenibacillus]|uniref:hypothetical protein n=1 Tax=Paenibacillus TaxID=44249 RepID=UPI0006D55DFA|nr:MULTISPECIES: hypothetical protein [Paenibacillus]KPV59192.1 hypothetical protein QJ48_12090 [Paenibacillus sp. A3]MCP1310985.1 hypothetical protein [Paenibacillus tyrfis]